MKKLTLIFVSVITLLAGCNIGSDKPNELDYEIQNFSYTNQNGEPFSLSDLSGEVWIADFIFTSCTTVCPPMTANMAKLQRMLKEEDIDAKLVSFSVDPEIDTPEKLKEFSAKFDADLSRWTFLTGYAQKEIEDFAKESFKTLVMKTDGQDQVTHGTSFFLIDQTGTVVKDYSGYSDTPFDEIIKDIKSLKN